MGTSAEDISAEADFGVSVHRDSMGLERLRRVSTQLDAIANVIMRSPNGPKKRLEEDKIRNSRGRGLESLG